MNTRELAIEEFKKLLIENIDNVDIIYRTAVKLGVTNEQYFLDWQDSLNDYSVDNIEL